jgi:hypothetical protein
LLEKVVFLAKFKKRFSPTLKKISRQNFWETKVHFEIFDLKNYELDFISLENFLGGTSALFFRGLRNMRVSTSIVDTFRITNFKKFQLDVKYRTYLLICYTPQLL